MKKIFLLIAVSFSILLLHAQTNKLQLSQEHPRYLTDVKGKEATLKLINDEPWAKDIFEKLQKRTDVYTRLTEAQPEWLFSRLAMYWESHATDVYIKGETFDHAGGEKAPVPTVRYTGTRGTFATHGRPRLEDVVPYDDDVEGNITFCNNSLPGRPMESVHPSKTGRNIESLNREIMGIARDAAFLYWLTDEEKYARLAAGVFDTYMQGIYYRNVPVDLNHGHQQTLVGMTSFEVIHEDILHEIVPLYDFLYGYLRTHYADKLGVYAGAFKKWADNIIDNGVPHNNWNLMQAHYVMDIGMVLEDNESYIDGKGREYYIDYVLNHSSIRQWSLKRLADYGYDPNTGIWAECPGYSSVVLNDYANFTNLFDRNLGFDLTKDLSVIPKAVAATPQYLFPNRMICGFGDTHPGYLNTTPIVRMIENAQVNGKKEQEDYFTALLKCLNPDAGIGLYLYSGLDYAEYYSQFPSHNTVCVDGISSYPVMKSNHAFRMNSCFPATTAKKGVFFPVTYSEVYFREPESCSDQTRLMGIVTTGPETGYYVDIFRSRKVEGGDKMHDYFYHNLGQTMTLTGTDGMDLNLQPTEELAFAGAHLYAYSYIYDKKMAETDKDVKATFTIEMKESGDDISMKLWMKGEAQRKVFTALSPMTEGYSRTPGMPYDIKKQPTLTFVARQAGEAWERPFVAVYEPSSVKEPGVISAVTFPEVECKESGSHVGIKVEQKDGSTDYILSSDNPLHLCKMDSMNAAASYALWGKRQAERSVFFLGNGTLLQTPVATIKSSVPVNVLLERYADDWYYTASGSCSVFMDNKEYRLSPAVEKTKLPIR
ncbi:MAG: hypothetical protein Q4F50_01910 [Bacteroides sp.]|uniref:hypothetical protein n=1 Tax=Bacteroides sp. TaxID=29523 RepID=UPI0026E0A600|nr:hypothetical protein [Bacteroides sp.]MDO5418809.1 hypothetical protein [Bacteroides sp.]